MPYNSSIFGGFSSWLFLLPLMLLSYSYKWSKSRDSWLVLPRRKIMIFRTSHLSFSAFFKASWGENTFSLVLISLLFSALHYTQILKEVLVSLKQVSIKENLVLLSFRLFMHCKCRSKSLVMTARFPVIPNSCKKSLQ